MNSGSVRRPQCRVFALNYGGCSVYSETVMCFHLVLSLPGFYGGLTAESNHLQKYGSTECFSTVVNQYFTEVLLVKCNAQPLHTTHTHRNAAGQSACTAER